MWSLIGLVWMAAAETPGAEPPVAPPAAHADDPFVDALRRLQTLDAHGYPDHGAAQLIVVLSEHASHEAAPQVRLGLARFLRSRGRVDAELRTLDRGVELHQAWAPWFRLATLDATLQAGDFASTSRRFDAVDVWSSPVADVAHFFGAWGRIGIGDSRGGRMLLSKVRGAHAADAQALAAALDGAVASRRSPGAAVALSIVPGLGHAYSGAWGVAAGSFVIHGGLGALTGWLVLSEDEVVLGSVVGVLVGASYLSFAADAGRRARLFNRQAERRRIEGLAAHWWPRTELTGDRARPLAVQLGAPGDP